MIKKVIKQVKKLFFKIENWLSINVNRIVLYLLVFTIGITIASYTEFIGQAIVMFVIGIAAPKIIDIVETKIK